MKSPEAPGEKAKRSKLVLLELVRFLAAYYVLAHHIAQRGESHNLIWSFLSATGQVPVMLFFVLSGFVIGLRHVGKKEPFPSYARSRFVRIYPVFSTVLMLGTVLMVTKATVHGKVLTEPQPFTDLLGNLFMVQGPEWFHTQLCVEPWAKIGPLWSLSFEWWFYMAFWAINTYMVPKSARRLVLGVAILATFVSLLLNVFPLLWLMLFSVWWGGVEMAREYSETSVLTIRRQLPAILTVACIALVNIAAFMIHRRAGGDPEPWRYPFIWTASGTVSLVVGVLCYRSFSISFGRWETLALRLGALSYAFYASHFFVVNLFSALGVTSSITLLALTSVVSIALADVIERFVHPAGAALIKRIWRNPVTAKA